MVRKLKNMLFRPFLHGSAYFGMAIKAGIVNYVKAAGHSH